MPAERRSYRKLSLWSGAAAVLLILMALLAPLVVYSFLSSQSGYYGQVVSRPAPEFRLQSTAGEAVQLSDFEGQYVYLMFGFLACEFVCHSQASSLALLNQRDHVMPMNFLYINMNPEMDSPQNIKSYFDDRGDNFHGLIADSVQQVQKIAADYGAFFSIRPTGEGHQTVIEHPAVVYLIDPFGDIKLVYTASYLDETRLLSDLQKLALDEV